MQDLPKVDTEINLTASELIRLEEQLCLIARVKIEKLKFNLTDNQLDEIEEAFLEAVRETRDTYAQRI